MEIPSPYFALQNLYGHTNFSEIMDNLGMHPQRDSPALL
jgi:hypothetical protein